jgi:hypothetical protein
MKKKPVKTPNPHKGTCSECNIAQIKALIIETYKISGVTFLISEMIGIIKNVSKTGAAKTITINERKPLSKSGDSAFGTSKLSKKTIVKPTHRSNMYTLNIYSLSG